MKTIEIAEATAPLAEYTRANRRHTLVIMRRGRPVAALMPVSTPADLESFKVSHSPQFQALIAQFRQANPPGTGRTTEQVRRALATRRSRRTRRS